MELINEFRVPVPIEKAWEVLTDLKLIAPCLPGAELNRVKNGEYEGVIKVKVGPIVTGYSGSATWVDRNHKNYTVILKADGKETKGSGSAAAVVHATLKPLTVGGNESESVTKVNVTTNLSISGKIAQLGRGLLDEVSQKLLNIFAENLANLLENKPINTVIEVEAGVSEEVSALVENSANDIKLPVQEGERVSDQVNSEKSESDQLILSHLTDQNQLFDVDKELNLPNPPNLPDASTVHNETQLVEDSIAAEDADIKSDNTLEKITLPVPVVSEDTSEDTSGDNSGSTVSDNSVNDSALTESSDSPFDLSDSLKEKIEMVKRDIDEARKNVQSEDPKLIQRSVAESSLADQNEANLPAEVSKNEPNVSSSVPSQNIFDLNRSKPIVVSSMDFTEPTNPKPDGDNKLEIEDSNLTELNPNLLVDEKLLKLANENDMEIEVSEESQTSALEENKGETGMIFVTEDKLSKLANESEVELLSEESLLADLTSENVESVLDKLDISSEDSVADLASSDNTSATDDGLVTNDIAVTGETTLEENSSVTRDDSTISTQSEVSDDFIPSESSSNNESIPSEIVVDSDIDDAIEQVDLPILEEGTLVSFANQDDVNSDDVNQDDVVSTVPGEDQIDTDNSSDQSDTDDSQSSAYPVSEGLSDLTNENIVELPLSEVSTDETDNTVENGKVISIFKNQFEDPEIDSQKQSNEGFNASISDIGDSMINAGDDVLAPIIELQSASDEEIRDSKSKVDEPEVSSHPVKTEMSEPNSDEAIDQTDYETIIEPSADNEPIDLLGLVGSPLRNRLKPIVIPSISILILLIIRRIIKSQKP